MWTRGPLSFALSDRRHEPGNPHGCRSISGWPMPLMTGLASAVTGGTAPSTQPVQTQPTGKLHFGLSGCSTSAGAEVLTSL
jgi:hypothetical protein